MKSAATGLDSQGLIGDEIAEATIFIFESADAGGLNDSVRPELRLPTVVGAFAEAVLLTKIASEGAILAFFENGDDLGFAKPSTLL